MLKDVLQIIGNYLDSIDFYKLKNLCNLSVDIYIKNTNVKVNEHHEYMDELIKRNLIPDNEVIEYATQYDIPKYVRLSYVDENIHVTYKRTCVSSIDRQGNPVPKIVEHNYKYYGFRLNQNDLNGIFENGNVVFMKIVQNYPQKSNVSILRGNNLWKLNYKHKIVHLMVKYRKPIYYLACGLFGIFNGGLVYMCAELLNLYAFPKLYWCIVTPLCFGLGKPSQYITDYMFNAFFNLKLPL